MLIISFAWTTPALLNFAKTCTRRHWNDQYAARFKEGMYCQAWNRSPRVGGEQVGTVYLTTTPYQERTSAMTERDFVSEGLAWMEKRGVMINGLTPRGFFERWKKLDELVWVVRFQLVSTVPVAQEPT